VDRRQTAQVAQKGLCVPVFESIAVTLLQKPFSCRFSPHIRHSQTYHFEAILLRNPRISHPEMMAGLGVLLSLSKCEKA
jgi:hypothetical protein